MAFACAEWPVSRVVQLLRELKLEQYIAAVEENEIDGPVLTDLARADGLHELGITSMIHRSKIRAALERLERSAGPDPVRHQARARAPRGRRGHVRSAAAVSDVRRPPAPRQRAGCTRHHLPLQACHAQ
eukprot:TRINITY_DN7607_c0_g1_i2.p2 TRINITY_DN7607_c0_g1~~TRINITY_DN7607_c0_g1_i2.p2  ORF type:complete len:129 (+),score=13.18 TRINITY_DN7607_c0_g1_i2:146-532(+)